MGNGLEPMRVRRGVEWALLALVVLVLVVLMGRHVRVIRGQMELSAIKSTLGALRTAFVIHDLEQHVTGKATSIALKQQNPFALLARSPPNYVGEIGIAQVASVAPGSWLFDPVCVCVGYVPSDDEWLASPSGSGIVWLQVSSPPAPFQLNVKEPYVWQGHVFD